MILKRAKALKILSFLIAIALLTLGIAACGSGSKASKESTQGATAAKVAESTTAGAKELVQIKTYSRKNCTSTPILVADKKGFFEAQGLKIEYTGEILKSAEILASVLKGNNDFADTHPNALATFVAGGAKIKGVARSIIEPGSDVDPKYRHMRWYATEKSGIKTWDDLINYKKGEKITSNGLAPQCTTFLLSTIFDKFKVGRDRISFVNFDTDQAALQAVEQGNIDIAGVHPTFYDLAESAGLVTIGDSSDAGLGEAAGVYLYYFTDDFIQNNPDTVQKFVNAVTKAQVWANENPVEAAQITSDNNGVKTTGSHYYSTTTEIPEAQIKPWIDDLIVNGKLKENQVPLANLITHKFEVK